MTDDDKTKKTILDLPKIIKIAREHTLLGCYETSLRKYQIALEIIQEREKEVSDVNVLRDKWKMTALNIKSEIAQTKQMLEACKNLTNTDFNYFKKQIESEDLKKKKFQEKNIMVFDMSNNNKISNGPNKKYFGSDPFSFNDPSKQNPFNIFQHDEINGIMSDSINSEINEDDEKILNPLKPQKNFGMNKKKKKKNNYISNNVSKKNNNNNKPNPWGAHNVNNEKNEKSMVNPLEQFDISNSNIGGNLDNSTTSNNITMDNNNTFLKEIKSFINKNQTNKNQTNNNQKRKNSMGKMKVGNKEKSPYPIGVGNYSNKNKIINFDKKTANKGALPVIMKKENQKYNNKQNSNKKDSNKNIKVDLNTTNKNDISGINMIDEALKKFGNIDNDESSYMDFIKTDKFV